MIDVFTIAVITIGQAPRPDITQDLKRLLPENFRITEYGALDGLTRQEALSRFGYRGRGELLITRMGGSGQALKVDGDAIMRQLQTCIRRAEADGAHAAMIACTGIFPAYQHKIPLFLPGAAQRSQALRLAGDRPIGVLIPKEDQKEQITQWWRESGADNITFGIADPYGDPDEILRAAKELTAAGAQVLCLDCFGYTVCQQREVEQTTGLVTVLPRKTLIEEIVTRLEEAIPSSPSA